MELWQLSATELATHVRDLTVHPDEVVASLLARIAELEPDLRAWVTVAAATARTQANDLARRLRAGHTAGILAGVPLGVKDNILTAGIRTTASSRVLADFVPEQDAAVVRAIASADAILLGKTCTSEFAASDPAPTRNPWNLDHTPGGSSSGSAAAVSAGMAPVALGTQTGGSILRPAAFTGIVGFKPSYGAVPTDGTIPLAWSFDHVGVLARSVADVALVFDAVARTPAPPVPANRFRWPPRLGVYRPLTPEPDAEIRAGFDDAVERLSDAGAVIEEVDPPTEPYGRLIADYLTILRSETATYHRAQFAQRSEDYRPLITQIIEAGLAVPAVDYVQALRDRPGISRAWTSMLRGFDAVVTPSTCTAAPLGLAGTGDSSYQIPWSYTGSPAISLPYGCTPAGLPLGLQVVGRSGADAELLRLAARLEEVLAFESHPPPWYRKVAS